VTPSGKPLDGASHHRNRDPQMLQPALFTMIYSR
jgi:hypothetical protein